MAMRFMVIERYLAGPGPVYERAAAEGRMLPDGLHYLDSWVVDGSFDVCFQLMETDDESLFEVWQARWRDLVDFRVRRVVSSAEVADELGMRRRRLGGFEDAAEGGAQQELAVDPAEQ